MAVPLLRRPWHAQATLNDATVTELHAGRNSGTTIYVTKVTLTITTHANAKFVKVQDDADTPYVIAQHTDATAAAGVLSVVTWDFGKHGIALTAGKDLDIVSEASGVAGKVFAEGYDTYAA